MSTQKHLPRCMVRWIEYLQQLAVIEHKQYLDCPLLISHYLQHRQFSDDVPNEITQLILKKRITPNDGIVFNFGCPTEIITDQDNNFTTNILNSYFKLISIKHILICAYHPWSSGVIERFNRLFGGMIAKHVADNTINKWNQYVDHALFVCRIR
ncbi:unnamed protein product [Rotaria sordida]|uniref:Integrase catalytic domain-containing protein n=1 Tax=Rotaria sordida TaxID=392033 RepID=A0A820H314_9BILA|nr:unnamed protein product [Rotaria sordida]